MSTIIKATDHDAAVQTPAFNFDDMAVRANQYLDEIRTEAVAILTKAKEEAEAVRSEAEVEGRKAGRKVVEQMVREQLTTALPALKQVVHDIGQAKQAWLRQWEKSAVHMATVMAGRLVRRELPKLPDVTLTLVREALELAVGSPELTIRLNPADHKMIDKDVELLASQISALGAVRLVADPEITPGGCRVETQFGVIDQQFEAQLARIEEELTY